MPSRTSKPEQTEQPFRLAAQEFDAAIDVSSITEHPENYNVGDLGVIEESMQAHGFFGGILVQRSTGYVLVGNHRYREAVKLGAAAVPGFWLDVDDDQAARIMSVDNRSAKLADPDAAKLVALLKPLQATPAGLAGTGYDDDSLGSLLRFLQATESQTDPNSEWQGMPDHRQGNLESPYTCHVHFRNETDRASFFETIDRPVTRWLWWPESDGHVGTDSSKVEVAE